MGKRKIYVDTSAYRQAHGFKEPKGTGNWYFTVRTRTRTGNYDELHLFVGEYKSCLQRAKSHCLTVGAHVLYLEP